MSSRGDDLAATTVDGVSVQSNIVKIEPDASHVLVTENSLFGGPLEASDTRVLDFVEILDSLGAVNEDVGASCLRAEAPDLPRLSDVILESLHPSEPSRMPHFEMRYPVDAVFQ